MIDLGWLTDRLCDVLRWQLANPGAADRDDALKVPWAGRRVWGIYLELDRGRQSGMNGPSPVSAAEMLAWSQLRVEPLRPWEIDILRALDAAYMAVARERSRGEGEDTPPASQVSTRPMSPALFDAIFPSR